MRILYYHQYFKTRQGAGGGRSYEFARRLVRNGHKVTVVCGRNPKEDLALSSAFSKRMRRGTIDDIDLIQIDVLVSNKQGFIKRSLRFIQFTLKSIKLVFKEDYDVLFASSTPLTIGIPGIILKHSNRRKTKFVFEVRDLWPELPIAMGIVKNKLLIRIFRMLENKIYKSADALIGLAPGMVEGIRQALKEEKRIAMIPNASDIDLFKPGIAEKKVLKCKERDVVAIFTGTHGRANGLGYIIDVCKILKDKGKHSIKIVLVGDGSEKKRLQERSFMNNLDNCIFLDPIPKNSLPAFMNAADIGMMILDNIPEFAYGTSPNKFFDYIASGLPVIVNHSGWVSDLVSAHKCGVTASPDDPASCANLLIDLSKNSTMRSSMGQNARILAEEQFCRDKIARDFQLFLEQVADD